MTFTLRLGDCLDELKKLPDNSVDACITDPPYGLSFMGKKWDYDVPSVEVWKEVLRVLKPGGHLLSFSSARTYHRMVVQVEDAGFEIRDQIMWVYGSGFPKNHNLGKYIHKLKTDGNCREVKNKGVGNTNGHFFVAGKHLDNREETPEDKDWEGWGTALKPAHEPIVLCRKPISEKNIAEKVLKWGTGGLNIDASRVPLNGEQRTTPIHSEDAKDDTTLFGLHPTIQHHREPTTEGRFPANFIHDGTQEVLDLFPDTKGGTWNTTDGARPFNNNGKETNYKTSKSDSSVGSAARFFYCPKAAKKERDAGCDDLPISRPDTRTSKGMGAFEEKGVQPGRNNHPTVKPIALMSYLIGLVTPPGGVVLDPFVGSGSTGCAAVQDGFNFIGIEMNEDYLNIANKRIQHLHLL